jgi:hypothetical protein
MSAGTLYNDGFEMPTRPARFLALESSQGVIAWACGADTLAEIGKEIDASETSPVNKMEVWDLDTAVSYIPEKKVAGFLRVVDRVRKIAA